MAEELNSRHNQSSAAMNSVEDERYQYVKSPISELEVDDEDRRKIAIMRSLVEKRDPSAKQVDDFTIRRFLRAREFNIDKASNLFLRYLEWRRSFVPNDSISPSEISNDLAQNKVFLQGLDKQGHPIVVAFGARHRPSKDDPEEFKRFVVYTLDKICARMSNCKEKFVCIGDLEGWGYSSSDMRGYLAALSILQDYYPERLEKLFVVHVPYIFMTAWKAIYPFIDNKTKKKRIHLNLCR